MRHGLAGAADALFPLVKGCDQANVGRGTMLDRQREIIAVAAQVEVGIAPNHR